MRSDHGVRREFRPLNSSLGRWASIAAAAGNPSRGCRVFHSKLRRFDPVEIMVSIFVGLLGTGATILAAYIQVNRSNLHSAAEKRLLNREMTVAMTSSPEADLSSTSQISLVEGKSSETPTAQSVTIPIQARPAFLDDLGVDPYDGELLLFMRRCQFKAGRTDAKWHIGWVVITTRRIVCRTKLRLNDEYATREKRGFPFGELQYSHDGFTDSAGVVIDKRYLKYTKARLQDHHTVLVEGGYFNQLLIRVHVGWFEPVEKVHHVLLATIQAAENE